MNLWQFLKAPWQVDEDFYLAEYPDVLEAALTGAEHYAAYGAGEGRHPNAKVKVLHPSSWPALFVDVGYYYRCYPDVERAPISARAHYVRWGRHQGRHPNALAEEAAYLKASFRGCRPDGLLRYARSGRRLLTRILIRRLKSAAKRRGENLICGIYDIKRLPADGDSFALRLIEPPKPFAFVEPQEFGQEAAPRERHVQAPALWVAEIRNATVIDAFQVISDKNLIVYEPAADPRFAFTAGASRHIASWRTGDDRAVVHCPYHQIENVPAAILLSGRCSPNYFHWLIEYLAKSYVIELDTRLNDLPVIVDAGMFPTEFESLNVVMPGRPQILKVSGTLLQVQRLYIPSQPTFHPDDVAVPFWQGSALCRDSMEYLKTRVLSTIDASVPEFPDKIYLARSVGRNFKNTPDVEAEIARFGFTMIDPSTLSFKQQVNLFYNARHIVGAMGAAFSNLIFCNPGTRVLTLSSPFTRDYCMQGNLGSLAGCRYTILAGTHPAYGDSEETKRLTLGLMLDDYTIEIKPLRRALTDLIARD